MGTWIVHGCQEGSHEYLIIGLIATLFIQVVNSLSWSSLALSPFDDKCTPPHFGHADPVDHPSDCALQGGLETLHFGCTSAWLLFGSDQSRDVGLYSVRSFSDLVGLPGRLEACHFGSVALRRDWMVGVSVMGEISWRVGQSHTHIMVLCSLLLPWSRSRPKSCLASTHIASVDGGDVHYPSLVIIRDTRYTAVHGGVLLVLVRASSFSSTHLFWFEFCSMVIVA